MLQGTLVNSEKELEPDSTEVELVPGFRVIVLTGRCPEIFEGGGSNFGLLGYFLNKLIGPPVKKLLSK